MIRQLSSDLIDDYFREIKILDDNVTINDIHDLINPTLTLKLSYLDEKSFHLLSQYLRLQGIPVWLNQKIDHSIIASFPNWKAVFELSGQEELQLLPEIQELKEINKAIGKQSWEFSISNRQVILDRAMIMGILNITPDSFSDGGKYLVPEAAIEHALKMIDEGADILDIGAESTRPGSEPVTLEDEWKRISPVLRKLRPKVETLISIDTYKAEIARRALLEGADIVNDISGLTFDSQMAEVIASHNAPVVMMHMKGTPKDMQKSPNYENLMEEIFLFFRERIKFARACGINQIIIDPGIGFGKRFEDNFEIIRRLAEFRVFGLPLLLGSSRKSFIGRLLNVAEDQRLVGTAATVAIGIIKGANIIRVHDVSEMREVALISQALKNLYDYSL